MSVEAVSDALHERVVAFARGASTDTFEHLAWDLARFQRECVAPTRELWGVGPFAVAPAPDLPLFRIPAVPVEAFRYVSVFAFEPRLAQHTFETSGTTTGETGYHHGRLDSTYEVLLLEGAKRFLHPGLRRAVVVALMPQPAVPLRSSLSFMARQLMQELDARDLVPGRPVEGFRTDDSRRWLLSADGVDVDGLQRAVALARTENEPLLLLTTSFALLTLLDQLGDRRLPLPERSVVMPTGGFKGRTREVSSDWLRERTQRALSPWAIVHEYGMTELSSQLYEATHPNLERPGPADLYVETRTVRVIPVDPIDHLPVPDGEVGLASFIDLGNVDSAVRVLTQDLVVRETAGIRLLGRQPRAPARGCSLLAESLVSGRKSPETRADTPGFEGKSEIKTLRTEEERRAALSRVEQLVAAARTLREPRTDAGRRLREALLASGPLSNEGVERALVECLEAEPSAAEMGALVDSTKPAPRVWVVVSANVFVAAHRAIALGLAASSDVRVKPSRREPHLTNALAAVAPGSFRIVTALEPKPGDQVHAYGSDESLVAIRATLPEGVIFLGHGDGIGVAWVAENEAAVSLSHALASDVALFDQRGCASLRVVALDESVEGEPFVAALAERLETFERSLPVGQLSPEECARSAHFRLLARVVAERVLALPNGFIAVQHEPKRTLLPPVGRNVVVVTGKHALERLSEAASLVTTVAVAGNDAAREIAVRAFPRARHCEPGRMQRPAFDGPLDRR